MSNLSLFKATDRDRSNLDRSLINIVSKLKKYKLQYPGLSNQELFEQYKKDNIDLLDLLLTQRSVRSDTFRLNAINTLLDNNNTFLRIYNEVLRDAKDGKVDLTDISGLNFTLNAEECLRTHVIDGIYSARNELQQNIEIMGITPYRFQKLDLKSLKKSDFSKETIDTLAYLKKSEFDRITIMTKTYKEKFESTLKQTYATTIMYYYEHFKKLGFIDTYMLNQMKKFPDALHVDIDDLDNFFTPENLGNLGITELSALYAFYSNRFTKELQELETLNFCLASGYSLDKFMEAEDPSTVIPEYMKAPLINEQKFISNLSDELLARNRAEVMQRQSFLAPENTYSSSFDLRTAVPEDVRKEYMNFFGRRESDFYYIMTQTFNLRNHTLNQYFSKDASLLALLSTIASNKDAVQNWGVILDRDECGTEQDKLNLKKDYLLLGFDIKGLNMPLRLHIPTDTVKDFAREYLESEYIPVYEGDNDFRYMTRPLSTPLLFGQPERIVKDLQTKVDSRDESKPLYQSDKLYSHLLYISNPSEKSFPDHLKTEILEGKKGKKKKKLKQIKRFVSVKSGEILTERQLNNIKHK